MSDFKLPPVSTLMGTTLPNYFRALKRSQIERKFYLKVVITFLIVLIATPFRWLDKLIYTGKIRRYKMQEPPLFVLGHWRSGTTLMHNLLCQDPQAGYLTTNHSVFPHHLSSRRIFENLMRIAMPERRPADNVKLSVKFPQEDEFTIGNTHHMCYYYWWYFPKCYKEYYEKYVRFQGQSQNENDQWITSFRGLVTKSLIDTNGVRAVFKNPVMTGRVNTLLEAYPNAKFIYMYRNPIEVFLSSQRFFMGVVKTLWFHEVDQDFIDEMILDIFAKIIHDFDEQKKAIPKENYYEIRFEKFQENPFEHLKDIYEYFGYENFKEAVPYFRSYIGEQKEHKVTKHQIKRRQLDSILTRWAFAMEKWKYDIPENLEIVD